MTVINLGLIQNRFKFKFKLMSIIEVFKNLNKNVRWVPDIALIIIVEKTYF